MDSDSSSLTWTDATVVDLKDESPTIKRLRLQIKDKNITFKAGQWIDFSIPGVTPFTGYSMCSPPYLLETSSVLELAVKWSDYPPTLWVHEKCKVGDVVQVRVSGDFFYNPSPDSEREDLLLIAGGVGINPIYSILQHFVHLNNHHQTGRATFLYSAQNLEELVFKDEVVKISRKNENVKAWMFSSRQEVKDINDEEFYRYGRMSCTDIKDALASLNKSTTQAYICGPSSFIDDMAAHCLTCGLAQDRIHYEKWWKH